jgi:small subunit ribosomal protein S1
VTGRIVSIEDGVARVELGEGIFARCVLPAPPAETPAAQPATTGVVDLSAFSSMLKSKWKSGDSPATPATSTEKKSELVRVGQVRSFGIGSIHADAKEIDLVLDPSSANASH